MEKTWLKDILENIYYTKILEHIRDLLIYIKTYWAIYSKVIVSKSKNSYIIELNYWKK